MTVPLKRLCPEAGQSVILFVFAVAALVVAITVVVDIGMFLNERSRLQAAADAAALAGASMLPEDAEAAEAGVLDYALRNGISADEVQDVAVTSTSFENDTVHVSIRTDTDYIFGSFFGLGSEGISASASAQAGGLIGTDNLAPFAVEKTVFEGLETGDQATLKYNATSSTDGNFLPLELDSPGGSEYRDNTKFGSETWLCSLGHETEGCSSTAFTETGNLVGPTRTALRWVFDNTSDECDNFSEVFVPSPDDDGRLAIHSPCNRFLSPSNESYQLIIVPVIESLCNGKCEVTILEFALFFLEDYHCHGGGQGNSCDLFGRYATADADIAGLLGPYDADGTLRFVRLVE